MDVDQLFQLWQRCWVSTPISSWCFYQCLQLSFIPCSIEAGSLFDYGKEWKLKERERTSQLNFIGFPHLLLEFMSNYIEANSPLRFLGIYGWNMLGAYVISWLYCKKKQDEAHEPECPHVG